MITPNWSKLATFPMTVKVSTGIANQIKLGSRSYTIRKADEQVPDQLIDWMRDQRRFADCFAAPVQDDLTVLPGVGEQMQALLRGMGVNSYADLTEYTVEALASIKGISAERAKDILTMAKDLASEE